MRCSTLHCARDQKYYGRSVCFECHARYSAPGIERVLSKIACRRTITSRVIMPHLFSFFFFLLVFIMFWLLQTFSRYECEGNQKKKKKHSFCVFFFLELHFCIGKNKIHKNECFNQEVEDLPVADSNYFNLINEICYGEEVFFYSFFIAGCMFMCDVCTFWCVPRKHVTEAKQKKKNRKKRKCHHRRRTNRWMDEKEKCGTSSWHIRKMDKLPKHFFV